MRVLLLCLFSITLAGCSAPQTTSSTGNDTRTAVSVPIYRNAEQLAGKSFRKLGEVSGIDCQLAIQDPPPNLATARQQMQTRASQMGANGVILQDCQIAGSFSGCRQQAICRGIAIDTSSQ